MKINIPNKPYMGRDSIKHLFLNLDNLSEIVTLDFSDVEFISRAPMHEIILFQRKYMFKLLFNDQGKEMYRAVVKSFSKEKTYTDLKKTSFKDLLG